MPLTGTADQPIDHPFFVSLKDLDLYWAQPRRKLSGILRYLPRSESPAVENKAKLLVCHDYKGGYKEKPRGLLYTFNFWFTCDIFVYFSHHRVTIPPPGWTNAAHRQGVKMLGTLIFEPGGEEDCLRLLVGDLPNSVHGPAKPSSPSATGTSAIRISPHYAKLLAELAHQRGFDGYLLNFECPLEGSFEQTRALSTWITILRSELYSKVGSHAEVIWYDSVIVNGDLAWQDRLNAHNLPFFLSSDGFFSNYTWRSHYPKLTAQYFLSLDPTSTLTATVTTTPTIPEGTTAIPSTSSTGTSKSRTLSDIYMGIDVWGRGSHGGGGFGCYRALSHIISPSTPGLSVALFGPAWTWETIQDSPDFTWQQWFARETTLWVGPRSGRGEDADGEVPEMPGRKRGEGECVPPGHGSFEWIASFFERRVLPDACVLPVHTTFSPGVGHAWFVNGVKVCEHGEEGWTDIDKQCSLGDLVWPRPELRWEVEEKKEALPEAVPAIDFAEAWNGGNSLKLTIPLAGSGDETASFRSIWVPVQSVTVRESVQYEARVVYKSQVSSGEHSKSPYVDVNFFIKPLKPEQNPQMFEVSSTASTETHLGDWSEIVVEYQISNAASASPNTTAAAAFGFTLTIATEDPSKSFDVTVHLGQLNVYPKPLPSQPQHTASISWANVVPYVSPSGPLTDSDSSPPHTPIGVLEWDTSVWFPPLQPIDMEAISQEDPNPLWITPSIGSRTSPRRWFPEFLYFNIYALPHQQDGTGQEHVGQPEEATWIGTTEIDGESNRFLVTREHLAVVQGLLHKGNPGNKHVRFFVQGVDAYGKVLDWEKCVFVDHLLE